VYSACRFCMASNPLLDSISMDRDVVSDPPPGLCNCMWIPRRSDTRSTNGSDLGHLLLFHPFLFPIGFLLCTNRLLLIRPSLFFSFPSRRGNL